MIASSSRWTPWYSSTPSSRTTGIVLDVIAVNEEVVRRWTTPASVLPPMSFFDDRATSRSTGDHRPAAASREELDAELAAWPGLRAGLAERDPRRAGSQVVTCADLPNWTWAPT